MKFISSFILLLASVLFQIACVHDPVYIILDKDAEEVVDSTEPSDSTTTNKSAHLYSCDPDTVYFENEILPIFIGSCAVTGCHNQTSRVEDLDLTNYSNIMKGISPGNPSSSKYYKVITLAETDDLMPQDPITGVGFRLPNDQVKLIENWINQGALNNFCEGCDTTNVSFSGRIAPLLSTNCATSIGCHSSGSANGSLTNYSEVRIFINNGLLVKRVITDRDMPVAAPLPDCEIEALIKWIDNGANDD